MILDFHTHTFPDAIAESAVSSLSEKSRTRPFTRGRDRELILSMKKAGIDRAVVLPVATNPLKLSRLNDVSIEKNGRDGLIFFGAAHPDAPDVLSEISRLARAGIRGVKIHPVYQKVDFDDVRTLRILDRAGEEGLCVVTHAGEDIGFPGESQSAPEKIARALKEVGDVKIVLAHMGAWRAWEKVAQFFAHTGVMLDTSFSLGKIPFASPGKEDDRLLDEEAFCALVRAVGAHRVLFGTDSPWTGQKESLDALRALPLTAEEKDRILGKNAAALLGLY